MNVGIDTDLENALDVTPDAFWAAVCDTRKLSGNGAQIHLSKHSTIIFMDQRESVPFRRSRRMLDIGCDVSMLLPIECTPIDKMARERRSIATQFSHSHLYPRNGKSRGA